MIARPEPKRYQDRQRELEVQRANETTMTDHKTGTRDEWLKARVALPRRRAVHGNIRISRRHTERPQRGTGSARITCTARAARPPAAGPILPPNADGLRGCHE